MLVVKLPSYEVWLRAWKVEPLIRTSQGDYNKLKLQMSSLSNLVCGAGRLHWAIKESYWYQILETNINALEILYSSSICEIRGKYPKWKLF